MTCGRPRSSTRSTATTRSGRAPRLYLESAKGILRSAVGAAAGTKFTPTLAFVADALPENAKAIEDLLDRARASDARVREASSGATYAGGADPYRKADDENDEDTASE